jgi:hypothetical protein
MKRLAILAMAAAATATAVAAPMSAASAKVSTSTVSKARTANATAAGTIRYAWLKGCKKRDYTVPCGSWTLALANGRQLRLADARVHPVTAGGRVDKKSATTFSVSGEGKSVAYFRKSDNKLVVRDIATNKVRALPGKAAKMPKGIGMGDIDTFLSNDGSHIAIDYLDTDFRLPSLIVNLATKKVRKVKANYTVQGFSPDGGQLLTTRYTDDNTTEFVVFDDDGDKGASQVVPQIVANNLPIALANDGTSVALMITTPSGKQRLRVYDLAADTVGDAVNVKVARDESALRLAWDSGESLVLWELKIDGQGNTTGATVRRLDPSSGASSTIDSFAIKKSIWGWWLPGE